MSSLERRNVLSLLWNTRNIDVLVLVEIWRLRNMVVLSLLLDEMLILLSQSDGVCYDHDETWFLRSPWSVVL